MCHIVLLPAAGLAAAEIAAAAAAAATAGAEATRTMAASAGRASYVPHEVGRQAVASSSWQ